MNPTDSASIVIDARNMLPPEPLERTLEGLDELAPGETLLLIIARQPVPLFDVLDRNGYRYEITTRDDGAFGILIEHAP